MNYASIDTNNMTLPNMGPKVVPVPLDFTTSDTVNIDLGDIVAKRIIDFVSGMYIYNTTGDVINFVCNGTNQKGQIPVDFQGYMTLLVTSPPKIDFTSNSGGVVVVLFYNFPQFPSQIGGAGGGSSEIDITAVGGNSVDTLPVNQATSFVEKEIELLGSTLVFDIDPLPIGKVVIFNRTGNADITLNLAGNDATLTGIPIAGGQSLILDGGLLNDITIAGTDTQLVDVWGGQ